MINLIEIKMSLSEKIDQDIKAAMLAREKRKLEALRAIKAALLLEKTKGGNEGALSEAIELQILQRLVKQRKESAGIFQTQKRDDLADEELFQASVIETYLPAQISTEELEQIIKEIIQKSGASGIKDMGKVMAEASGFLAGKSDNKTIAEMVRKNLSN